MTINIPNLLHAAGGEIVGKVRLQKVVYLLDQMGMDTGLSYTYHHYGPYSAELSDEIDFDVVIGDVRETVRRRVSDGVPYSVFRMPEDTEIEDVDDIGEMPFEDVKDALDIMDDQSSTVLELAATIHWLVNYENIANWREELEKRKGPKTQDGRAEKALVLLRELDLEPED